MGLVSPPAVAAAWKKAERKYWQILKAFQGTLQRSWLDTDHHLGDIVSSIANLRVRIGVAAAAQLEEGIPEWHGCGYRSHRNGALQRNDMEMTLSHNLRQHEKMLGGLRTVVSSLANAQEILGRRLEEMVLFHQETTTLQEEEDQVTSRNNNNKADDNVPHTWDDWAVIVNRMERVYTMLAVELYRKQRMVQRVLDSSRDDLLSDPNDDNNNNGGGSKEEAVSGNDDTNGLQIAEECVAKWSRDCKASAVQTDILQQLLEL